MRRNKLLSLALCLLVLLSGVCTAPVKSAGVTYTVAQVQNLCDGIVASRGAYSAQDFIDGWLCDNAGISSEFYAIALSQSGDYDFSNYESALLRYLDAHTVSSASSREKYALALSAAGSRNSYITDTADTAIGGLGLMSLVFGLHLLNNGYPSAIYSTDGLISDILAKEKSGGGWAVVGSYADVDVTAMTIQSLAPHYGGRSDLTAAVDRGIAFLSSKQLSSGGFKTMGAENCESAAQVVIALSDLGIDAQYDSRFVKNGVSALAAMMQYRRADGGFAHDGGGSDESATVEAFCALTAYMRMCRGQSAFYVLDHANHSAPSDNGSGGSNQTGGGSHAGSSSGSSGSSGTSSRPNSSGSPSGGQSSGNGEETDSSGNRVIVIDGRRYIEATTATGEKMTVAIEETQAASREPTACVKSTHGAFQSDATAFVQQATADQAGKKGIGYKPFAILGVLLLAGGACLVLFLLKKRNIKHYIVVAVFAAAGVLFILLTNFQSADSYRQPAKTDGALQVTLTIRCDTVLDRERVNHLIPDDGVILDTTTYYAAEGDTVYDVLMQAVSANDIPLYDRGTGGSSYIAGINGLYEFDYGELSGWMYRVNGTFPDVGCRSCTVHDGDKIEWLYTTNIGRDL